MPKLVGRTSLAVVVCRCMRADGDRRTTTTQLEFAHPTQLEFAHPAAIQPSLGATLSPSIKRLLRTAARAVERGRERASSGRSA